MTLIRPAAVPPLSGEPAPVERPSTAAGVVRIGRHAGRHARPEPAAEAAEVEALDPVEIGARLGRIESGLLSLLSAVEALGERLDRLVVPPAP